MNRGSYQYLLGKKGRQFISHLRTHYREQGSLEAGDFLSYVVKI